MDVLLPEAYTYGSLFIAFLEQVFFRFFRFLLRNVMFCTCAMQFYRVSGRAGAIITSLLFTWFVNKLHLH